MPPSLEPQPTSGPAQATTAAGLRRRELITAASLLPLTMNLNAQTPPGGHVPADDPYLWLEDVESERSLAWVRQQNAGTRKALEAWPLFDATRQRIREVLDSKERIPALTRRGPWLYNLWQDAEHPRGLWRRTSLAEYRKAEPAWDTLLDIDALGRAENTSWVFDGFETLGPEDGPCLVRLSRGGADAAVVREFDLATRRFVDGGFEMPEAKGTASWIDRDTWLVATDTGTGSTTAAGYPRQVRRWRRGTPLTQAPVIFEGQMQDVGTWGGVDLTPGQEMLVVTRAVDFYRNELWVKDGLGEGPLQQVPKPDDAQVAFWNRHALISLRSDWALDGRLWPAGSLLVCSAADLRAGRPKPVPLFTPTATRSLDGYVLTRGCVLLSILDNVAGRLQEWRPSPAKTTATQTAASAGAATGVAMPEAATTATNWTSRDVQAPHPGTLSAQALHDVQVADDPLAEAYLLSYRDFLTPDTQYLATTGTDQRERLKSRPTFFDAQGMRVEQRTATSSDGTRIPYFLVWPRGAKADGRNPTLLYGYGGFEVSQQPWYSGSFGSSWYGRGGVLAVANIRGGGEFGPTWHQAAVREHKQRSYDDFAAVAQDLIRTRVTRASQLGIMGGSNGGLLVGAVMLQKPELLGAVVCQVPLLDMRRYHQLLAGASWMAEYGDPDKPEEWAFISRYSPYQNVRAGQKLPPVLFITSTRDDRVHPGHARKMAARMLEQGHRVRYYENIEGGHGGAADNAQRADMSALEYAFLWQNLGGQPDQRLPPTPSREASR
jgi:prolyl oligopeptidase